MKELDELIMSMNTPHPEMLDLEPLRTSEEKSNEESIVEENGIASELAPSDNYAEVMNLLQVKTEVRTVTKADGSKIKVYDPKPLPTGFNFLTILSRDMRFADLRFNTVRGVPERVNNGKRTLWTDTDDADAQLYIETAYHIFNAPKYANAFNKHMQNVKYNPVREAIEATEWDGQSRVEEFLIRWAGADDNAVNRECSRLMFAGGIRRAYEPGSKFDYCIVLIGVQGAGKSTLCQWLALDDDFYASLKTIQGQKGSEGIQGKWIVEIEELLAMYANGKSSMAEEAAKAFLSRQSEFYRLPYAKRPTDNLRTNIFIGTTNQGEFLEDPTGNRRWYPVTCCSDGIDLRSHEKECREYIRQCWAEMLAAYRSGDPKANTYTDRNLEMEIKKRQRSAEVDDGWAGRIEYYLDQEAKLDRVCLDELWYEAINYGSRHRDATMADKRRIGSIMSTKLGWIRGNTEPFDGYGRQKAWKRPFPLHDD